MGPGKGFQNCHLVIPDPHEYCASGGKRMSAVELGFLLTLMSVQKWKTANIYLALQHLTQDPAVSG